MPNNSNHKEYKTYNESIWFFKSYYSKRQENESKDSTNNT